MKKILVPIIIVALILATACAVFFGITAQRNKAEAQKAARSEITLLQDKYTVGDNIVFEFVSFNGKKITTLKYAFNNGDEVTINGIKSGETSEYKGAKKSTDEKYYVDSGIVVIDTDEMETGWYHLTFFGYDADDNKIELNTTPYLFKLVAAQSSNANA